MSAMQKTSEPTLGDLMVELWRGRLFVLGGLVVGLVMAAVFVYAALPHYRAAMILSPASPMGALSSGASSEKDSVSGVSGPSEAAMFTRFEAMYKGVSVAGLLLRNEDVLAGLKRDRGFVFSAVDDEWNAPKLAEYIGQRVVVDPVGETDLRQFYYEHIDADFAALFVQQIHATTDGLIRYEMRRDVNERIAYLQDAMREVRNPEHRRGLTDLLMEQERLKMLVSINQAYAASLVEPSASLGRVFWPNRALVMVAFSFAGALIGFVIFSAVSVRRVRMQAQAIIVQDDKPDVAAPETSAENSPRPSRESRDLAERSRRKMQEWIKRDSGNNNEPAAADAVKKKPSAAE
jgi:hypothetical protein